MGKTISLDEERYKKVQKDSVSRFVFNKDFLTNSHRFRIFLDKRSDGLSVFFNEKKLKEMFIIGDKVVGVKQKYQDLRKTKALGVLTKDKINALQLSIVSCPTCHPLHAEIKSIEREKAGLIALQLAQQAIFFERNEI